MLTPLFPSLIDGEKTLLPYNLAYSRSQPARDKPDADGIETVTFRFLGQALKIRPADTTQGTPLAGIYSVEALAPGAFTSGLNLYKNQRLSLPGDQVDFTSGKMDIPRQDLQAIAYQVARRAPFTQPTQCPTIRRNSP